MNLKTYISITAVILIAFIVVIVMPTETYNAKPVDVAEDIGNQGQTISFSEEDRHNGDLILVNFKTRYPKESENKLELANVFEEKSNHFQVKDKKVYLAARIIYPMERMLDRLYKDSDYNTTLILSGYRTREYQEELYEEDVKLNGKEHAREYVAKPGYSEHHTGLAVDLGIQFSDGTMSSFANTDNEKWIRRNCYKYGFIRRYPDDKTTLTGIAGESWHFRYVGLPHAYYIHKHEICMEEYISFIQNNATAASPLTIAYKNTQYNIYYTKEKSIKLPENIFYNISGDNQGGYIITTAWEEDAFIIPPMNTAPPDTAAKNTGSAVSGSAVYGVSGSVIRAKEIIENHMMESEITPSSNMPME